MEARTTARMAAFIPGASPPEVKTPIFFSVDIWSIRKAKNTISIGIMVVELENQQIGD
jgi:hypothetical protein